MCRWIVVFSILMNLFSSAAFAEEWYSGSVQLKNDQVLRGKVSLRPEYDVVLFKVGEGDEVSVLPAYKVELLTLVDPDAKSTRKFVTLHIGEGPKSFYQFYEIVVDGKVPVFRRQHTLWYSIHLDMVDYDYYVVYGDEMYSYTRFKRKVYPKLVKQFGSVERYVADNSLNLSRLTDVLKIVEFYNVEAAASLPVASTVER